MMQKLCDKNLKLREIENLKQQRGIYSIRWFRILENRTGKKRHFDLKIQSASFFRTIFKNAKYLQNFGRQSFSYRKYCELGGCPNTPLQQIQEDAKAKYIKIQVSNNNNLRMFLSSKNVCLQYYSGYKPIPLAYLFNSTAQPRSGLETATSQGLCDRKDIRIRTQLQL